MALPIFDIVPIIQSRDGIRIGIVTVAGVSTSHSSTNTDAGRLYFDIVRIIDGYRLDLFSDYARSDGSLVVTGEVGDVGQFFALDAANGSGVTGRARLEGGGDPASGIAIVSFATDVDILKSQGDTARFPGYDPTYGLAAFHSAAMRQILTSDLPAALPQLYRNSNLSAFAPMAQGSELPDLSRIQNAEALRAAQANLVKALSAQEAEHTQEFSDIAAAARARYVEALKTLTEANTAATEVATEVAAAIQFGSFVRG